ALDDLADGAAFQRLAYLKRRNVAFHVVHPSAHVRGDRRPQVLDAQLAVFDPRQVDLPKLEILEGRHAARAALEVPGAGHLRSISPSVQRKGRGWGARSAPTRAVTASSPAASCPPLTPPLKGGECAGLKRPGGEGGAAGSRFSLRLLRLSFLPAHRNVP